MTLPKGFKIKGVKGLESIFSRLVHKEAVKFLESLPFRELVTTRQVCDAIGMTSFAHETTETLLSDYRWLESKKLLWGSKRTIRELKRQVSKR